MNGSTVTVLARDGQKSVRAEIQGSAVTGSWRYRAYGTVVQSSGSSTPSILGYAGQLLDPSGLYYMRARWYDSSSGRMLSRDPLLGSPKEPASLASSGYAGANPVATGDPTGLAAGLESDELTGGCGSECLFRNAIPRVTFANPAPTDPRMDSDPCFRASGPCTYWVTGAPTGTVEVRNNADGIMGLFVGAVGFVSNHGNWNNTMTVTPNLIVSTTNVPPSGALISHELGHTIQALEKGFLGYYSSYLAGAIGTDHGSHPMELDANHTVGLPPDWNGYTPADWAMPFQLTIWRSRP